MKIVLQRNTNHVRKYTSVHCDCCNSEYRTSSVVDDFYKVKSVSVHSGKDVNHHVDPIYMLFNQERLQKTIGYDNAKQFLDSLVSVGSTPLAELRKKCSDEDLLATIKSRNLQQPSEILNWARYMNNNVKEFNSAVEAVKAMEAQQAQQTSQGETSPTT